MKTDNPALEFDGVEYAYPNGPVSLKTVRFSLPSGSKIALVGPNGAGKTTLLLMCNGILRPDRGEVRVHGRPLSYDRAALREIRKRVGFVFQNSENQIFAPTVYQDVAFGPVNLDLPPGEVREAVHRALFSVGLSGFEKRPPHHLSGGEKKRVAIAGVLAMDPDILVFDEPTSSLDPATAAEIMDLLDELNSQGKTVIISTHDVQLAYSWADQVVLISEGTILHQGTPASVFTDPDLMNRARLTIPPVLELFMTLRERNISIGDAPPAGIPEMAHQLEQAIGCVSRRTAGHIYVVDAESVSGDDIRLCAAERSITHIGAMGTAAKILAGTAQISLDFTYGVIDKCLLKSVMGEDTLIITSGGMIERVHERIRAFSREHGVEIPVSDLTGQTSPVS
jgi:cobalt/nickel transport system ATP-binding protein